jgi:hypothetical protein
MNWGVLVGHGERTRIWVFSFERAFWLRLTLMNNDSSTIEQLAFSRLYTYSVFVVWNVTCDKGCGNAWPGQIGHQDTNEPLLQESILIFSVHIRL